jgi:HlyD family secretion protein
MQSFLSSLSKLLSPVRSWFLKIPGRIRWIALGVLVVLIGLGIFGIVQTQRAKAAQATQQAPLQTAVARQGNLILRASGTGTLIAADEVNLAFKTSGVLTTLNVKIGDQVTAGQLLAQLDNSNQQIQLAQAQFNLNQLTSPAALATAQQAVVTAQNNLTTAQYNLNSTMAAGSNQAAIDNAYAALALAQAKVDSAQSNYDPLSGQVLTNPIAAQAYRNLYAAQQTRDTALKAYNTMASKASSLNIDSAKASLALAQAQLTEAQNLVTALTGGTVPPNATGSGLNQLIQARIALQTAQANLDATKLASPISGTVMVINNQVGETAGSGTFITIADLSQSELQIYMDQNDWNNIQVGYTANVTFDALPDQAFIGKVTQVSPQLVSIQGNSVVEGLVLLDKKQSSGAALKLPLGVSGSVDVIAAQATNVILVPVQALHQLSPGNYAVFVMTAGKPSLRIVTVGLQDSTYAEIKTGLKAGDVVTTGIQATTSSSAQATP